jgi:FkbM family methyltransferase
MGIRRKLARIVEKVTHTHILRTLPRGLNPLYDVTNCVPHLRLVTIFDIGANVGQSCRKYIENIPNAEIYCFESVSKTFLILEHNLRRYKKVHNFKLAFGAAKGKGYMRLEGPSDRFFVEKSPIEQTVEQNLEEVAVDTVDNFCSNMNIGHINYMKIDTEGGDLDVLLGAENMLQGHAIDIVEVEAGMNPTNRKHVSFEIMKKHLNKNPIFYSVYTNKFMNGSRKNLTCGG